MGRVGAASVILLAGLSAALGAARADTAAPPPIRWGLPDELPAGTVGKAYSHSLCVPAPKAGGRCGGKGAQNPSGGLGHYYVFSLHLSKLPPGLALSARSGLVKGTPTKAGTYRFTVCAQEAEAARTPGIRFVPACDATRLRIDRAGDTTTAPATTTVATTTGPPAPSGFGGTWKGTYGGVDTGGGCSIPSGGAATVQIQQAGNTITGTATFAGGWVHYEGAPSCAVLGREDWRISFTGTANGTTATITYTHLNNGEGGNAGTLSLSGTVLDGKLVDAQFQVVRG